MLKANSSFSLVVHPLAVEKGHMLHSPALGYSLEVYLVEEKFTSMEHADRLILSPYVSWMGIHIRDHGSYSRHVTKCQAKVRIQGSRHADGREISALSALYNIYTFQHGNP